MRPQGYSNAWPEYFHSFGDKVAQQPETRRPHPGPRAITVAKATLLWLEPQDARLVWLRANRTAGKPICWECGISRATANRRWELGLSVITCRQNGKRVPARRSMDQVIQRAR